MSNVQVSLYNKIMIFIYQLYFVNKICFALYLILFDISAASSVYMPTFIYCLLNFEGLKDYVLRNRYIVHKIKKNYFHHVIPGWVDGG